MTKLPQPPLRLSIIVNGLGSSIDPTPTWLQNAENVEFVGPEEAPDLVVAVNHSDLALETARSLGIPSILLGLEPPCVEPRHAARYACRRYSEVILTHSRNLGAVGLENLSFASFPIPIAHRHGLVDESRSVTIAEREDCVAVIAANKCSLAMTERYLLRRKIMEAMSRAGTPYSLFGAHWAAKENAHQIGKATIGYFSRSLRLGPRDLKYALGKISNVAKRTYWRGVPKDRYNGPAASVLTTYRKFQFALVVENDSTFTSEKAFDALDAGCLVFYLGEGGAPFPREAVEWLPHSASGIADLIRSIQGLPAQERETLRRERLQVYRQWLNSNEASSRERGITKIIESSIARVG